ncbi:MAG: polysaccharide deacetylase family protein [Candidatus Hinthialibacter antarcticus]|nr:polysaccharide deacetylase family protein [Candidatus Hinthialibacter antarcticus]
MRNIQYLIIFFILCSVFHSYAADDNEIRLIVRADDIGCAHAVNLACIEAYTNGVARTVEVMVPGPWFLEAVEMLNQHPNLDVGVHLTLTSEWKNVKWRPLTHATSFVDAFGYFFPMTGKNPNFPAGSSFLEAKPDLQEVERELRAQIETAKKYIHNVSHLSSHMGTPTCTPELRKLTQSLADEYGLPIGLPDFVKSTPRWSGNDKSPAEKEAALIEMIKNLKPGTWLTVEHPGHDVQEMQAIGHKGYENVAIDREGVTRAFCSEKVKAVIKQRGIKLLSYSDILSEN